MTRLKKVTFVLLVVQKALEGIQKSAFERVCHLLKNFMKVWSVEDDFIFGAMTDMQTILHLIFSHPNVIQNYGAVSSNVLIGNGRGRWPLPICILHLYNRFLNLSVNWYPLRFVVTLCR
jgi:hypothetical protein